MFLLHFLAYLKKVELKIAYLSFFLSKCGDLGAKNIYI